MSRKMLWRSQMSGSGLLVLGCLSGLDLSEENVEFDAQAVGNPGGSVQSSDSVFVLDESDGLLVEPGEASQAVDAQSLTFTLCFEGSAHSACKVQMGIVGCGWGRGRRHPLVINSLEATPLTYKSRAFVEPYPCG